MTYGSDSLTSSVTTDSDHHFVGNPNVTAGSAAPSWSNVTLFVPEPSSGDKRVGFLPPNDGTGNATTHTSGFAFYGSTAMLYGDDGSIATSFSGIQSENGIYELFWNDTEGTTPLTLRKQAPSNPPSNTTS